MQNEPTTIETLTRTVIREKILAFNERERDLCNQAHEAWKSGNTATGATVSDHERNVHDRARALLNGAGGLLPQITNTPSQVQAIETELGAVRLALRTLNRADVEKATIETATWAIENTPAWHAKIRKLVLAVAALREAAADCDAFADADGRSNSLPHMGIYRGYRGIDLADFHQKDWFDISISEGVVKASELKGARNAR